MIYLCLSFLPTYRFSGERQLSFWLYWFILFQFQTFSNFSLSTLLPTIRGQPPLSQGLRLHLARSFTSATHKHTRNLIISFLIVFNQHFVGLPETKNSEKDFYFFNVYFHNRSYSFRIQITSPKYLSLTLSTINAMPLPYLFFIRLPQRTQNYVPIKTTFTQYSFLF